MTGKLRSWMHANKHSVVVIDNDNAQSTYDTSMVDSTLANGTYHAQPALRWQPSCTRKGSVTKWVWLCSNLSIDPASMDGSLDLNGDIISHDFPTPSGRLDGWGLVVFTRIVWIRLPEARMRWTQELVQRTIPIGM